MDVTIYLLGAVLFLNILLLIGLVLMFMRLPAREDPRLKAQTEEERLEQLHDAVVDSVLEGVRAERREMQLTVTNTERNLSQAMANLTSFVTDQQTKSAGEVRTLNETVRASLADMQKLMHLQLLELQAMVDQRFARIIQTNNEASQQLGSRLETKFDEIRTGVEGTLEKVRQTNETKLEEMRTVVQEKLDKTLTERLTSSFRTVDEKLGLVQTGLGEMRQMASSVRDLRGVLTNVKTRGSFGETQLSVILSNILTSGQFEEQVRVIPGSTATVDFAVRMPGASGEAPCWLPVDSKFPMEDYERLLQAQEAGDAQACARARSGLERAVLVQAKSIHDKYVRAPYTTEFAVMYLPSESLYAEVIRLPGLFERMQREFRITPAGPTVISALVNSLQLGFVTLALQERSSEVWKVLGDVKGEFLHFAEGFARVQKKFSEAQSSLDAMKTRQSVMQKKMSIIDTAGTLASPAAAETTAQIPVTNGNTEDNPLQTPLN